MERVHYRKYTPSKLHTAYTPPERPAARPAPPSDFREKLIVQGIISGIIFAVVLLITVVDNPLVSGIRGNLGQAISSHITAEEVAGEISRFLGDIGDIPLPGAPVYVETAPTIPEAPVVSDLPAAPVMPETPTGRIDEDMLREMLGDTDDLQTTAPGPMTMPEL